MRSYPIGGYAPGNYIAKCTSCGKEISFVDKLATQCEVCALWDKVEDLNQRSIIDSDITAECHEVNKRKFDDVSNSLRIALRSLEVMSDNAERFADEVDLLKAHVAKLNQELSQYPTKSEIAAMGYLKESM